MRAAQNFAVVVLAAGQSTRMGPDNKLLIDFDGEPMIRRTVKNITADLFKQIIVVTGHESQEVEQALSGFEVQFVYNDQFESGMASSLRAGVSAVDGDVDGALVVLGDMPLVSDKAIGALIDAFEFSDDICVPYFDGKRGNPVLWGRAYFDEITSLYGGVKGDVGAKGLIKRHECAVRKITVENQGVLRDFDTFSSLPIVHAKKVADKNK